MDHTLALIGRAHQGDKEARDTVFEENTGLVYSVARRFLGRGAELEDLVQIGGMGLLKAVDKFDLSFEVRFSSYAVPMIAGEIRRYLRDNGMLKVSRSIKEGHYRIYQKRESLERDLGREPTIRELAEAMALPVEELVFMMESGAEVESLEKKMYQGEESDVSLMDRLPEQKNGQEELLNRIFLEELLGKLSIEERQLICLRYFKDLTQTQIGKIMKTSQVQVSRMEKRILRKLREEIEQN